MYVCMFISNNAHQQCDRSYKTWHIHVYMERLPQYTFNVHLMDVCILNWPLSTFKFILNQYYSLLAWFRQKYILSQGTVNWVICSRFLTIHIVQILTQPDAAFLFP